MNINRNNYEKYFIDYLEGTLSKDDIHDLRVFLLFNQDLAELLDDIAKIKLTAPSVRYTRKENLKKEAAALLAEHPSSAGEIWSVLIGGDDKIFQTLNTLPVNKK